MILNSCVGLSNKSQFLLDVQSTKGQIGLPEHTWHGELLVVRISGWAGRNWQMAVVVEPGGEQPEDVAPSFPRTELLLEGWHANLPRKAVAIFWGAQAKL